MWLLMLQDRCERESMSDINQNIALAAAGFHGPSDYALGETPDANRLWSEPVLTVIGIDSITCAFAAFNEDGGTQVS